MLFVEVLALLTLRVIDLSLEQRLTLESERSISAEGILSVVSVIAKAMTRSSRHTSMSMSLASSAACKRLNLARRSGANEVDAPLVDATSVDAPLVNATLADEPLAVILPFVGSCCGSRGSTAK